MDAGITMGAARLRFQLTRKDLYRIIRITAWSRPFRKVAVPALAGMVFLSQAVDGHYLSGALWGAGVAVLYWGVSNLMLAAYAYLGSNQTLLVPQEIELTEDRMIVSSEHSREEFMRPLASTVKAADGYLTMIPEGAGQLLFLRSSFSDESDYEILKKWAAGREGRAAEEA